MSGNNESGACSWRVKRANVCASTCVYNKESFLGLKATEKVIKKKGRTTTSDLKLRSKVAAKKNGNFLAKAVVTALTEEKAASHDLKQPLRTDCQYVAFSHYGICERDDRCSCNVCG